MPRRVEWAFFFFLPSFRDDENRVSACKSFLKVAGTRADDSGIVVRVDRTRAQIEDVNQMKREGEKKKSADEHGRGCDSEIERVDRKMGRACKSDLGERERLE